MDMKNLVRVAMLVVAFASACCAQEAVVNVSSKAKQKWSPSEVDTVYLAACTAVQREFGDSIVLRPPVALVLGAETNAVDFDKKTILLKRWDHTLFAQGVVVLAFEDLLTPQRRMMITNRAVNLAQATVNIGEIGK
jgi:mitochondrial fission protein ELM1